MIEFRTFHAGHLATLVPQRGQESDHGAMVASGDAERLAGYPSASMWAGNRCVACGGCVPVTPHRAVAWIVLSDGAAPYMLKLARHIRKVAAVLPYRRIELTVSADFEAGHRFASLIGAVRETDKPMRYYGITGGDEFMYAIYKGN